MINNRQNGRRRGRGGAQVRNGGNGPDRGNRIDNRSRGNAAQLLEKYKNLARDAQMQGDRVMTEYYLQFADHYFRVLGESRQRFEEHQPRRQRDDFDFDGDDDAMDAAEAPREERREREPREERREREPREVRAERAPREVRAEREAPAEPQLQYGVEGETARPDEDGGEEGRRPRRRRTRRTEGAAEEGTPRIEVDRLPPAFAPEPEPVAAVPDSAPAAESAPTGDGAAEAPVRRRRTRRVKVEEEGDNSVAA